MGRPEVVILDEPTSGLDPLVQREVRTVVRELADDGCAVLLSSHVLSEVDEVADRVSIIRGGVLVATEAVATLRAQAVRRLRVRTAEELLPEALDAIDAIDGASVVATAGANSTTIAVTGSMDRVIKALARFEVLDLVAGEPDLEEVFLAYYQDDPEDGVDDAA
ncbi:AAA family ATPase [Aquihabitans daechungensis]|uniref:AAA family ATPase n=1 Tax=Aquihabitans daechungensis TaxID=1052257 RepID=UPI003B9EFCD8